MGAGDGVEIHDTTKREERGQISTFDIWPSGDVKPLKSLNRYIGRHFGSAQLWRGPTTAVRSLANR